MDIGGTFTDIVLLDQGTTLHRLKVPSTPADPIEAVREGVRRILADSGRDPRSVGRLIHGSTVATNAVLERKGARVGLLTTQGFEDVLEIGRQKRSSMYDLALEPETPVFLAPRRRRIGIGERIAADGSVVTTLPEDEVRTAVETLVSRHGVEALAVCYLFSFLNPSHELRTREIAHAVEPRLAVSLSCEIDPQFREYERTVVTALDAYLRDAVEGYVGRLKDMMRELGLGGTLHVIHSRGGITTAEAVSRRPVGMLLSGLAAGVIGARDAAGRSGVDSVITLDMGGTSCDVALVRSGKPLVTQETRIERYPLRVEMIDVNTIGAGGGSIAWVDDGSGLRVGPQSAGADPGPACYGRGGREATVTDASLVLGYLNPKRFAGGELSLDAVAAEEAVGRVGERVGLDPTEAAYGIHAIVNARMANEIRLVSVQRGFDPRDFTLLALGGAGPVHAGTLAQGLGLARVLVPDSPGVLSAFGLLVADIEHDHVEAFVARVEDLDGRVLLEALARLDEQASQRMRADGVLGDDVTVRHFSDMRYLGQSYEVGVELPDAAEDGLVRAAAARFHELYDRLYGSADPGAEVELVSLRTVHSYTLPRPTMSVVRAGTATLDRALVGGRPAYFRSAGAYVDTPVYERTLLPSDAVVSGPAIIEQSDTTVVVNPGQDARVDRAGALVVEEEQGGSPD